MTRLAACAALLLAGCGLVHHDVSVELPFQAGGGAPTSASFDGAKVTAALAGSGVEDVTRLHRISVVEVRLESTDDKDLAFVSDGVLSVSAHGFSSATVATLPSDNRTGQVSVNWNTTGADLRPYLAAGATIDARLTYSPAPVSARGLKLVLVVRAEL